MPKEPLIDVVTDFLMSWDIDEHGSRYTALRLLETITDAGYKIVSDGEQGLPGKSDAIKTI